MLTGRAGKCQGPCLLADEPEEGVRELTSFESRQSSDNEESLKRQSAPFLTSFSLIKVGLINESGGAFENGEKLIHLAVGNEKKRRH